MKLLYLECKMGAAGDMLMGALYELLSPENQHLFLEEMNRLALPGVKLSALCQQKCGIYGTHMQVLVDGEEEHTHNHDGHEESLSHHHDHDGQEESQHHHHDHDAAHGDSREHQHEHTHTHEEPHKHEDAPIDKESSCEHAHGHEHSHGHHHAHAHTSYSEVLTLISSLPLPESVTTHASAIYRLIGEAEAKAHASTLEQIHFHEVGTIDALADVVGCCLLMDMLRPDEVIVSPIHVGSGTVHCAHGILPVPAPATAEILKGVPIYSKDVDGELCTPTGAALLRHFATSFSEMPLMEITATGYGMGTKDFAQANCVRAFLGNAYEKTDGKPNGQNAHEKPDGEPDGQTICGEFDRENVCKEPEETTTKEITGTIASPYPIGPEDDCILMLSCNLDDMTGEELGFALEELMAHGAKDAYCTPILMKKGRPGQLLTCLCAPEEELQMTELIFKHTTTRGIRVSESRRHVLSAKYEEQKTPYGPVTIKESSGYQVHRRKPEYEDLANIARTHGLGLPELKQELADAQKAGRT